MESLHYLFDLGDDPTIRTMPAMTVESSKVSGVENVIVMKTLQMRRFIGSCYR